jgi:hypothetical protein
MPQITVPDVRRLIDTPPEHDNVLYLDDDTIDVGPEGAVHHSRVIVSRANLMFTLGGDDHPDGPPTDECIEEIVLPELQREIDEMTLG